MLSKTELALQYMPNIQPRSAVNRLAKWLKLNPSLWQALTEAGYRPTQKVFTQLQVDIIWQYLGEP
ncbi:MAG: DUF4248 domain-containing protein [Prevotellaceae bacterium]|nr:DUF4248 domain-containing protein [Candidatus Minthosoma caballi]